MLVTADETMSVTALHYTALDLFRAAHTHELRPRSEVILCIDYAQCGLGNGSCGPPVLDAYALKPEACSFGFSLSPSVDERGPRA